MGKSWPEFWRLNENTLEEFASASHFNSLSQIHREDEKMGTISAASGTTVLSSNLRRQNIRRLGLYDRRHENLSVVSSSQPPVPPRQRWLHVPERRLEREIPRLDFVARAADSTSSSPSMVSGDKTLIPDDEFTLAKVLKSLIAIFFFFFF